MYNPNDDPDATSGLQDDAKKEMTYPGTSDSPRYWRLGGGGKQGWVT